MFNAILLHGGKAAGRSTLVDDGDYDFLGQYRWNVWEYYRGPGRRLHGPYAITNIRGDDGIFRSVKMHTLIMGIAGVDHLNGDGLDNQRANLRPATRTQNGANMRPQLGSSSRYKGVVWDKRSNRWMSNIVVNKRHRTIGYFISEEDAAQAYDEAALEAWAEYARPNFPPH
jgi:hypothetical protein